MTTLWVSSVDTDTIIRRLSELGVSMSVSGERLGDEAVGVGTVISCEVGTHDAVKKHLYLLQCLDSLVCKVTIILR